MAVDCGTVVEALIREHLTKKKLINTLSALQLEQVSSTSAAHPAAAALSWTFHGTAFSHHQQQQQPASVIFALLYVPVLQAPLQHTINKRSILQDILGVLPQAAEAPSAQSTKPSVLELLVQQLLAQKPSDQSLAPNNSSSSGKSIQLAGKAIDQVNAAAAAVRPQSPAACVADDQQQTWSRRLPSLSSQQQQQPSSTSERQSPLLNSQPMQQQVKQQHTRQQPLASSTNGRKVSTPVGAESGPTIKSGPAAQAAGLTQQVEVGSFHDDVAVLEWHLLCCVKA